MEHFLDPQVGLATPSDGLNNLSLPFLLLYYIESLYQFELSLTKKLIFLCISGCVEGRNVIF